MLLALLGIWGALIPFVGPYFGYAYTPDKAWTYTTGRLWLEILPGVAALLGGLLLIVARSRHTALSGAFVGVVSGAWFVVGNVLAPLWTTANPAGIPAGTTTVMRSVEDIGFFTGLGVVMVLIAAMVAGRLSAVPGARTVEPVGPAAPAAPVERGPVTPVESERTAGSETAADSTAGSETAADSEETGVIR